jgi:signal transduction histidine kinase/ligand-binding sensor domain-containing protein/DNA-binding response OmpR family regulator
MLKPGFHCWLTVVLQVSVLFLSTGSNDLLAQEIKMHVKQYSISEGLSHSVVNDITQDANGFIWIGTDDGLNRFDGKEFKIYRSNHNDDHVLNSSNVTEVFIDSKDRMWVGTSNGLNLYNPDCDCFYSVLDYQFIHSIAEDKSGNIYTGSEGGIRIIEHESNQPAAFTTGHGLPSNSVQFIFRDRKGNILLYDDRHLMKYDHTVAELHVIHYTESSQSIVGLEQDIQGFLWLCTTDRLIKFDSDNNYQFIKEIPLEKRISKSKGSVQFIIDSKNHFWIGGEERMYQYLPERKLFTDVKIYKNRLEVDKTKVEYLYEDRSGNMWFSLYASGVFVWLKDKNIFTHVQKIPYKKNSLTSNIIGGFAQDNKGKIWVGTWGKGLNVFDPETGQVKPYVFKDDAFNNEIFRELIFLEPSSLWLTTHTNGVLHLDTETGVFEHYHKNDPVRGLSSENLFTIYKDSHENIWVGSNESILMFEPGTKTFVDFNNGLKGIDDSPKPGYARIFEEDKYGNLWVGTHFHGLYHINLETKAYRQFLFQSDSVRNQLNSNIIYSLYEDKRGFLWIGTMGGGVNIYNPSNKTFYHLTEQNGLPNNIINGILGRDNTVWFSTNKGLVRFVIPSFMYEDTLSNAFFSSYNFKKHLSYFDPSDGIQSIEFRYGSYFESSSGDFYFGGVNGFNMFDPEAIEVNGEPPKILITDFYLHGERQLPVQKGVPLDSVISLENKIVLNHEQNYFSFDFLAVNFVNPTKNRYRYRLLNFDDGWTETSTGRSKSYMNLPPGEYIFEAMVTNSYGIWPDASKKIQLIITPPLWKRTWFQAAVILILTGILFGFFRYRIYMVKQNNVQLERKVARRTQQLQESNQLLEKQKEEILEMSQRLHQTDQMKLRFFTNISHDFRTPLTLILGPLEQLLGRNDIAGYIRSQLTMIYKNAFNLLKLINELLDFRKLDTGNLELKANKIEVIKFVTSICSFFTLHAKRRNIQLKINTSLKECYIWIDPYLMEKVFSNMISNAFKHTSDGGNIEISVNDNDNDPESIRVVIEDDGEGIDSDQINMVFDRYYQVDKATRKSNQYGSGIGLALCKEYVEMHNGKISASNKVNGGARFTIVLLKGEEHFSEEQREHAHPLETEAYEFNLDVNPAFIDDENQHLIEEDDGSIDQPTVLLIDDNMDMQRYVMDILKGDYRVLVASNGEEGWTKAVESIPDLILLDIMMPVVHGLDLGRKLKKDPRTSHIPIIIVSARVSEEDKLEGFQAGADDYMVKPFSGKMLKSRIKARIENRRKLMKIFNDHIGFNPKGGLKSSPEKEFLKRLIKILDKHLSNENFNTELLAREMNLSRTQLYRKVLAITEQSASDFIRSYKMRKAAELLQEGKYNISEVAFKLGFKSLPHFTRTFSAVYKETPSKFLNNHR